MSRDLDEIRSDGRHSVKSSAFKYTVLSSGQDPFTSTTNFTPSKDSKDHAYNMVDYNAFPERALSDDPPSEHLNPRTQSLDAVRPSPTINLNLRAQSLWRQVTQDATLLCILLTFTVLLINIVCTVWVIAVHGLGSSLPAIYSGRCDFPKRANTWIHLAINILASILLGASNRVMQALCAPSRAQVEAAHERHKSLTISSTSLWNLQGKRLWIWLLLWASSMPIHLLYNSMVVFTDTNAAWASYFVLTTENAIKMIDSDPTLPPPPPRTIIGYPDTVQVGPLNMQLTADYILKWISEANPSFQRLDIAECVSAYATGGDERYGDALLVSLDDSPTFDGPGFAGTFDGLQTSNATIIGGPDGSLGSSASVAPWDWMCPFDSEGQNELCTVDKIAPNGRWVYGNTTIDHCLSRITQPACQLNFSLRIALAVLVCNVGKLIAMTLAFRSPARNLFLTIGDAVASFLRKEDAATKDTRIISRNQLSTWRHVTQFETGELSDVAQWKVANIRNSWAEWAPRSFMLTWMIVLAAIILCAVELGKWSGEVQFAFAARHIPASSSLFWGTSIGVQPFLIQPFWGSGITSLPYSSTASVASQLSRFSGSFEADDFVSGVLRANLPQLGVSTLYLCCNAMFSNLFKIREWNSYGTRRQGLRVTSPQPGSAQRSTYFLAFPLKYSLPFLGFFAVIHWLVSQTLFLTRTFGIYPGGRLLLSRLGFSPIGLLCTILSLTLLVLLCLGSAFYRVTWRIPAACGESAIIGAACHPPPGEKDTHLKRVQWGVTNIREDGLAECSFSCEPVQALIDGQRCLVRYEREDQFLSKAGEDPRVTLELTPMQSRFAWEESDGNRGDANEIPTVR